MKLNDTMDSAIDTAKKTVDSAVCAAKETAESAVCAAKETAESAAGSAKHAAEAAKKGTEHAASSAFSTITDGIRTAGSALTLIRSLGLNDALGWVGLQRRRSPFEAIALFGSGVIVGAGVGMLFAPMSGGELRAAFLKRLQGVEKDAKATINKVEQGAEDLAGKAKEAVVSAEHKVEDLAGKAKDAVVGTAQEKAGDLVDKADKAKDSAVSTANAAVDTAANKAKDVIQSADRKAEEVATKAKDAVAANVDRRANGVTGDGNHRHAARHT